MRTRRHFVEQQPAIGGDEELNRQKPHQIDRFGKRGRGCLRRFYHCRNHRGRGNASCQNAIEVAVLCCWKMTDGALGIAGQQGADLAFKADQLFQDGVIAVDRGQRRGKVITR